MDPLEIAAFVYEFPPAIVGGLGTYAMEITQQFVKLGHDVTVFTLNDGTLPTRDVWRGVEIHRPILVDVSDFFPDFVGEDLRHWGRGLRFFEKIIIYNILSSSKLVNRLVLKEGRKFDLIAAHDWLSIVGGFTVKREEKIPLIFHVHSTERGRSLGKDSHFLSKLEHKGGQISDRVITVSLAMRDELVSLGFPEAKIRVCYNGIDPRKYDPSNIDPGKIRSLRERYGIKVDEKIILFVGRLVSVKGADRLIMAMPEILRDSKCKLVIVGTGDMQNHLLTLVRSLHLEDDVKFRFEFITEEERILHYAACDLAVFPSLYEPFGIVCLESMSMAKPVVVGAAGISGMRETIITRGSDQCGYHINPYDPSDIAKAALKVLKDDGHAKFLGENGRRRVLKYFTWEEAAKNTIQVYRELLNR